MTDARGFPETEEEAQQIWAGRTSFLLVEPQSIDASLTGVAQYCMEKMPFSQVYCSDIAGIPSVLEKIAAYDDLYVYLSEGLQAYAHCSSTSQLNLVPPNGCHAFGIAVPISDCGPYLHRFRVVTQKILSDCRAANVLIPLVTDELQNPCVVGSPVSISLKKEDIYEGLQQLVVQSFVRQIEMADLRFRAPPIKRSGTQWAGDIMHVTMRYALVLDEKHRKDVDEHLGHNCLPWKGYFE